MLLDKLELAKEEAASLLEKYDNATDWQRSAVTALTKHFMQYVTIEIGEKRYHAEVPCDETRSYITVPKVNNILKLSDATTGAIILTKSYDADLGTFSANNAINNLEYHSRLLIIKHFVPDFPYL